MQHSNYTWTNKSSSHCHPLLCTTACLYRPHWRRVRLRRDGLEAEQLPADSNTIRQVTAQSRAGPVSHTRRGRGRRMQCGAVRHSSAPAVAAPARAAAAAPGRRAAALPQVARRPPPGRPGGATSGPQTGTARRRPAAAARDARAAGGRPPTPGARPRTRTRPGAAPAPTAGAAPADRDTTPSQTRRPHRTGIGGLIVMIRGFWTEPDPMRHDHLQSKSTVTVTLHVFQKLNNDNQ